MHMMKRGLIALTMTAAIGGVTGGLLATAASATSNRGREVIRATQYEVGAGEAVGPWTGHGAINTKGNVTNLPSLATDPANTNRTTLVDPTGSFSVLASGGTPVYQHMNPTTCAVIFVVKGVSVNIVSGTGAYAKATGHFIAGVRAIGYVSRTATGCDQNPNDPTAFETDNIVAVGHINLHNS